MPKSLKLGTIVHDIDKDRYLICIQPICDSVRIKADRVFVFVQLETFQPPTDSSPASHVIVKQDDTILELVLQPKSYMSFATTFAPDAAAKMILAEPTTSGTVQFSDTEGRRYVWLDQLKTSHAQRAVERFASDLSRVGLTESEWQRRLEKK